MTKFSPTKDGEWVQPIKRGYRIACCDCGLVHRLTFRIVAGRVQFRATRDPEMTANNRRRQRMKYGPQ